MRAKNIQNSDFKGFIESSGKKATFEGPAEFVLQQVAQFMGIDLSKPQAKEISTSAGPGDRAAAAGNERQFVNSKNPKGHHETVAVLAYLLTESGKPEFGEEDLRRAYIRAGVRPPKVIAQALRDAKNKFDYLEVGSTRGMYRLTNHGDRTVRFDLPRSGSSN